VYFLNLKNNGKIGFGRAEKKHRYTILITVSFVLFLFTQVSYAQIPELGAEVWIRPGQSQQQINHWFKLLAENNMRVARIFIMWNYIEPKKGQWDFSLYDKAFKAANKYGIKIFATLTSNLQSVAVGDFYQLHVHKMEGTKKQLNESKKYIKKVVNHYKNNPALSTWGLTNEAGQSPNPYPLALKHFRRWLQKKYQTIDSLNTAWRTNFTNFDSVKYNKHWSTGEGYWYSVTPYIDWHTFWRGYLAWWLKWIKKEVQKYDPNHPFQAHAGGTWGNLAYSSIDLPSWASFANSLGASIHPAWMFGDFHRSQYALAISYLCDLLRGSSNPKPFWVTELQGGTNIHSGYAHPLTPTSNDIAQWTWTSIGAGAKRVIYWLLNSRTKGEEAGEWSMLDYQNRPTKRLTTAGSIAKAISKNKDFFREATPIKSPVTILLSLKTMTLQSWYGNHGGDNLGPNAHIYAAFAYYEALNELGIPARIKFIDDYNWDKKFSQPQLIILPDLCSLSLNEATNITRFVRRGNTALITGLTGIYGPNAQFWPLMKKYPLEKLLGAKLKQILMIHKFGKISLSSPQVKLSFYHWMGQIDNQNAQVIGKQHGWTIAVKHKFGKGKAIWIPAMIGLGTWHKNDTALTRLLSEDIKPFTQDLPFKFQNRESGCLMRVLQKGRDEFVTIITNGTNKSKKLHLKIQGTLNATVIWGRKVAVKNNGRTISLQPRETVVLHWSK
jgi:beta-galactosidase